MAVYNKLTKQLLAEGYTTDNYPKEEMGIYLITYMADLSITAYIVRNLPIRQGAVCM